MTFPEQGHVELRFKPDCWIELRTTGPVNREAYARFKPFLREHFRWNWDTKVYEVYTRNNSCSQIH